MLHCLWSVSELIHCNVFLQHTEIINNCSFVPQPELEVPNYGYCLCQKHEIGVPSHSLERAKSHDHKTGQAQQLVSMYSCPSAWCQLGGANGAKHLREDTGSWLEEKEKSPCMTD